jgi:DNA-binding LacI/PurR family transcriptional regulator
VDAVFCFNEMQAIGAADALQKRGFRIPEDVSVASMYGTTVSTLVKPAITSVEKPVEKMAKEAARIIVSRIENPDAPVEDVVIPSQMYIRESSDIVFKSV